MTTQSWAFAADHQTDAGFRAWGADFAAKLAAVGMVQTSDTGQINWGTVTRPGTSTDGGYEVWKFNDTPAGTAPIFIKFSYGTGAVATRPRINVIVGTGSNGSGTITGTALTSTLNASAPAGTATGASFTSYMCHANGIFWFVWQAGGAGTNLARGALFIARTLDGDGVPTVTGALIVTMNASLTSTSSSGTFQCLRFASTAAVYAVTSSPVACGIPMPTGITTTLVGGAPQAFLYWTWAPQVTPVLMAAVLTAEIAEAATYTATLIGTTSRTFISMRLQAGVQWTADTANNANFGISALWE